MGAQNKSGFVAGVFVASRYFNWQVPVYSTSGQIAAASPATLPLAAGNITLQDGDSFVPFAVNGTVLVGQGANQETVTITAVSNAGQFAPPGTASIAGNTSNTHGEGDLITSATGGLLEACLDCSNSGGGTVVLDPSWKGSAANIVTARGLYPAINIVDMRQGGAVPQSAVVTLTSAQLKALQTTAINIVPAPGAGFLVTPKAMLLDYVYGATAYTIGNSDNTFRLEYTGKTTALIAPSATGLVDQTANTAISQGPAVAQAAIASSNCVNLGLEVKLAGTTPALTLGDGTVKVVLQYLLYAAL